MTIMSLVDIRDEDEFEEAVDKLLDAMGVPTLNQEDYAWDESKHPRRKKGDERGGEFAPKGVARGTLITADKAKAASLAAIEDKIVGQPTESIELIDDQGKYRGGNDGDGVSAEVPPSFIDAARINGNWTLTHNHPTMIGHENGTSFSVDDILIAEAMNLKQIRAVTKGDLGKFTFSMTRPDAGWPGPKTIKVAYNAMRKRMEPAIRKWKEGKVSASDLNLGASHAIMAMMSRDLGMDYKMVRAK